MYLTEQEIFSQPQALGQTVSYFNTHKERIETFFQQSRRKKVVFMGCGSSYMLSKSGENLFSALPGFLGHAVAGGDYLINPDWYQPMIQDGIVVMVSRSGMTSEILRAAEHMKTHTNALIFSVTMKEQNTLAQLSDLNLDLPWAYDESVCQTRTVTNLYAALLLLYSICGGGQSVWEDVASAVEQAEPFLNTHREELRAIAQRPFSDVVVLGDGPLCGLAEEGSLAFTEIALISGRYSHLLDYRHGPIVLNGKSTLTILMLQPENGNYQSNMVADLKSRGGIVVVADTHPENRFEADCHIYLGEIQHFACCGIPFIAVCQMIAFYKACERMINPDQPKGLDAFIALT